MISPSLTNILISAVAIGALMLSSFKFLGITAPLFRAMSNPKKEAFRPLLFMNATLLIIAILCLKIYGLTLKLVLGLLLGILVFNILYFGIPLLQLRSKRPLEERLKEWNKDEDKLDLMVLIVNRFGPFGPQLIVLSIGILGLSYLIGNGEAFRQTSFLTIKSRPDVVVLRTYGDRLICAPFDKNNKEVKRELLILNISMFNEINFLMEEIGPLVLGKKEKKEKIKNVEQTLTDQTSGKANADTVKVDTTTKKPIKIHDP